MPADTAGSADPDFVLRATLVRVIDGDTLKATIDSGPLTVRLHGIDTPERKQPLGAAATKALRSLVEGQPLEIQPIEQNDGYGRMVAKIFVAGDDVGARMVGTGYAWAYRRYLRHQPADENYCKLEADARIAGRGVWTGAPSTWVPPWEFRAGERGDVRPAVSYAGETTGKCLAAIGVRPAGGRKALHSAP